MIWRLWGVRVLGGWRGRVYRGEGRGRLFRLRRFVWILRVFVYRVCGDCVP